VSAGASALREAQRAELRIAEYERRLLEERARAGSFHVAARTEAELAARLRAMDAWGWRLLEDRRWPGTRGANVDLILIGPGGVLVIDVKCWAEPDIVDGRLYRGQDEADRDVDKLRRQAELVTDAAAAAGLAPSEVVPVMVFMNQRGTDARLGRVRVLDEHSVVPWAVRRGARLAGEQVDELVRVMEDAFPPCDAPAPQTVSVVISEPVLPAGRHQQPMRDMLFDAEALEAAVAAHTRTAPIEDWMTFLHPDQVRLIRRVDSGPARIRGAAGTGKTVVALHRAAYLAESLPGPVLFTTFVKSLPPVLSELYRRLAPASDGRIEFTNLHAWALQFLARRGRHVKVDPATPRRRSTGPGAATATGRAWRISTPAVSTGRTRSRTSSKAGASPTSPSTRSCAASAAGPDSCRPTARSSGRSTPSTSPSCAMPVHTTSPIC
jgi:hypothetical protein